MEESQAFLVNVSCFNGKVNGRTGAFYIDPQCPVADAKEMLFQFLKILGKIEDSAKQAQEAEKEPIQEEKHEE